MFSTDDFILFPLGKNSWAITFEAAQVGTLTKWDNGTFKCSYNDKLVGEGFKSKKQAINLFASKFKSLEDQAQKEFAAKMQR